MELQPEKIQEIINRSENLTEAIEGLYKEVFPDWEEIKEIEGWPRVGRPANQMIFDLLGQKFGREAMMIWCNCGFGTLYEDSFRVSLEDIKIIYHPRCPWCGKRHPAKEHQQCAPDAHLEAAYEERFEPYG